MKNMRTPLHSYREIWGRAGGQKTGPSGNSIFLPTSDVYIDIDDTLGGFYWCSTTGNTDDIGGDFISFSKDYVDFDGSVPINVMNIKPVFK